MRGSEFIIMGGPVHTKEEYETTPYDIERPPLEPGQAAQGGVAYKEILSFTGLWQWKIEWEILPNA